MANRFVFDGLDALKAALRDLPDALATEAGRIVEARANAAAVRVRTVYGQHRRTGNLQEHLKVEPRAAGRFGVAIVVKSTARHAYLFEVGTAARHYITVRGVKKEVGASPGHNIFVPAMREARRQMYEDLKALLVRNGLQVSGDAAA